MGPIILFSQSLCIKYSFGYVFLFSFIVFLPEMKEANFAFMTRVEESHFKRKLVVVPGMVHEYRHGYQHVLPK